MVPLLIVFCKLRVKRLVIYIIYNADSVLMILTSVTISRITLLFKLTNGVSNKVTFYSNGV